MREHPSRGAGRAIPLSSQARRLSDRVQGSSVPPPEEALDAHLLRWLLHYPFQRIQDIALGLRATPQTIRRHLQALVKAKFVEQVTFAYSVESHAGWFYLTTTGIVKAATHEGIGPVVAAQTWQADERSLLQMLPRFPALLAAQNLINSLISGAPAALAFQGHPASVRWRWTRNYELSFRARRRIIRCEADTAIVLRRQAQDDLRSSYPDDEFYTLLLFLDLGMTAGWTRAMMTTRLRRLLLYRESVERAPFRSMFPLIVILTESEQQMERWHQAALEATHGLGVRLGTPPGGVIVNLAEQRQESAWHYDWRILGTHQHCRLTDRLQPMTKAAIPPGIFPQVVEATAPPQAIPEEAHRTRIVRGKFEDRLRDLPSPSLSRAKERELIALLGLSMSLRFRTIMLTLFASPLVSTEELGIFLGHSQPTVNRYLWTLQHWHCVHAVKRTLPDGSGELRWKLSVRGLHYIRASQQFPMSHVFQSISTARGTSDWQPGVYSLQKYLHHTAGVYGVLARLSQAAMSVPTHRILWMESHMHCAHRYLYRGSWRNFRPDATVAYQVTGTSRGNRRWLLWLEWDGGTMEFEQLRRKMASYAFYLRSREWRKWGQVTGTPCLVVVVPDRGQLERMRKAAQEQLKGRDLPVYLTTQTLLEQQGFLAAIWIQAVPAQEDQTNMQSILS